MPADNKYNFSAYLTTGMAEQILRCEGPRGKNIDYVLELARELRKLGVEDPHVFDVEARLLCAA